MTKNQKIGAAIAAVVVLVVLFALVSSNKQAQEELNKVTAALHITSNQPASTVAPTEAPVEDLEVPVVPTEAAHVSKDPQNATYSIDGHTFTLTDGQFSSGSVAIKILNTPTTGDMNSDGAPDAGIVLVGTNGGSGTFYYAAVAINNTQNFTYDGTNAMLLGDRIEYDSKDISGQVYTVHYKDREAGQDMSTPPSHVVNKAFTVSGTTLSAK